MSSSSKWWPETIGRLELEHSVAKALAVYVDPLDGQEYRAGREQAGRRRRGWWVHERDESRRAGGYRNFDVGDQDDAIRQLRSLASADVGAGDWTDVEISVGEQAALDEVTA